MKTDIRYYIYKKNIFRVIKAPTIPETIIYQEFLVWGFNKNPLEQAGYWVSSELAKSIGEKDESKFIPMNAETLIRASFKEGVNRNTIRHLMNVLMVDL